MNCVGYHLLLFYLRFLTRKLAGSWQLHVILHDTCSDDPNVFALEDIDSVNDLWNRLSGDWVAIGNEESAVILQYVFAGGDATVEGVLRELKASGIAPCVPQPWPPQAPPNPEEVKRQLRDRLLRKRA